MKILLLLILFPTISTCQISWDTIMIIFERMLKEKYNEHEFIKFPTSETLCISLHTKDNFEVRYLKNQNTVIVTEIRRKKVKNINKIFIESNKVLYKEIIYLLSDFIDKLYKRKHVIPRPPSRVS